MRFTQFPPSKAGEIEPHFSSKVLSRAREIVAEELVELLERSPTHLSAKVQGS